MVVRVPENITRNHIISELSKNTHNTGKLCINTHMYSVNEIVPSGLTMHPQRSIDYMTETTIHILEPLLFDLLLRVFQ